MDCLVAKIAAQPILPAREDVVQPAVLAVAWRVYHLRTAVVRVTYAVPSRPPLGLKPPKAKPDPAYLAQVRLLPCCICEAFDGIGVFPSDAHHPICGRYSQAKVPDRMAIPLCHRHHLGPDGIHASKDAWMARYGPDTDYIAGTQDRILGDNWQSIGDIAKRMVGDG